MTDAMPRRQIGDLSVSVVGLGANNFGMRIDQARTREVIEAVLQAGINLIDTADSYGGAGTSERFIGESLGGRRDEVVLATKFGSDMSAVPGCPAAPRGSRTYIRWAVEGSLARLRTSWIDLYQYHRPDRVTPIEETLAALDELVDEGKVRWTGCSNFTAAELDEAAAFAARAGIRGFASLQNDYSLLDRELEVDVLPACARLGVQVLPYYPLASGLLTGKYRRGEDPPAGTRLTDRGEAVLDSATYEQLERLAAFAADRGVEMTHVAIAALLARPQVSSVIAGATNAAQVAVNAGAAGWTPTAGDLAELDAIFPPPRPAP